MTRRAAAAAAALLAVTLPSAVAPASAARAPTSAAPAPAAPPAARQAAGAGADWLAGQLGDRGYLPGKAGPDGATTASAAVALHAAGRGDRAAPTLRWLSGHAGEVARTGGADNAGNLATLVLAVRAAGGSPTDVGGVDLVTRLKATQRRTGKDAGLFGAQDSTYDGAFRQGLALLALTAAGLRDEPAVGWLTAQQCADGGWQGYRADIHRPCPATDPKSFAGPDTNSTAVAFQGLRAAGAVPKADALGFLAQVQGHDGGFALYADGRQPADPNSTAVAIQAILAGGEDPAGGRWAKAGGTPYDRLLTFQLQKPAADRGAFWFDTGDGTRKPNLLATVQAVPAAAGRTFPLAPAPIPTVAGPTAAAKLADSSGFPAWGLVVLIVAGVALGAGMALLLARGRARRGGSAPA